MLCSFRQRDRIRDLGHRSPAALGSTARTRACEVLGRLRERIRPACHLDSIQKVDEFCQHERPFDWSAGDLDRRDDVLALEPQNEGRLSEVALPQGSRYVGRNVQAERVRLPNGCWQRLDGPEVEGAVGRHLHRNPFDGSPERRRSDRAAEAIARTDEGEIEPGCASRFHRWSMKAVCGPPACFTSRCELRIDE
jgi:hypothetical protein